LLYVLYRLPPRHTSTPPAPATRPDLPPGSPRHIPSDLPRAHMTIERAPEVFFFHDPLQAYASELTHATDSADQRHQAVHRMLDHYLHTATAADMLVDPHRVAVDIKPPRPGVAVGALRDPAQARAWLKAEHHALVGAVK